MSNHATSYINVDETRKIVDNVLVGAGVKVIDDVYIDSHVKADANTGTG